MVKIIFDHGDSVTNDIPYAATPSTQTTESLKHTPNVQYIPAVLFLSLLFLTSLENTPQIAIICSIHKQEEVSQE
jgi:hypothetical protein